MFSHTINSVDLRKNAKEKIDVARACLDQGLIDEAFNNLLNADPRFLIKSELATYHLVKGRCFLEEEKFQEALAEFKQVKAGHIKKKAYPYMAKCHEALNDKASAQYCLYKVELLALQGPLRNPGKKRLAQELVDQLYQQLESIRTKYPDSIDEDYEFTYVRTLLGEHRYLDALAQLNNLPTEETPSQALYLMHVCFKNLNLRFQADQAMKILSARNIQIQNWDKLVLSYKKIEDTIIKEEMLSVLLNNLRNNTDITQMKVFNLFEENGLKFEAKQINALIVERSQFAWKQKAFDHPNAFNYLNRDRVSLWSQLQTPTSVPTQESIKRFECK